MMQRSTKQNIIWISSYCTDKSISGCNVHSALSVEAFCTQLLHSCALCCSGYNHLFIYFYSCFSCMLCMSPFPSSRTQGQFLVSRNADFDTWKNVTSVTEQKLEQSAPRAMRKLCFSLSEMKLRWGGGHKALTYLNLWQADYKMRLCYICSSTSMLNGAKPVMRNAVISFFLWITAVNKWTSQAPARIRLSV